MARSGTPRDEDLFIVLLATGHTIPEAATASGLSRRTAYRRAKEPEVCQKVRAARSQAVDVAVGKLSGHSGAAAAKLHALLEAKEGGIPDGPPEHGIQLGAAKALLELCLKLRTAEELEKRIKALEEQAAQMRAAIGPPAAGQAGGDETP